RSDRFVADDQYALTGDRAVPCRVISQTAGSDMNRITAFSPPDIDFLHPDLLLLYCQCWESTVPTWRANDALLPIPDAATRRSAVASYNGLRSSASFSRRARRSSTASSGRERSLRSRLS